MSDMEIRKPGIFQRAGDFLKREIDGEKEKKEEGTWSNSTLDYVTKGGVTGGLLGAGLGAVSHAVGGDKTMTYKYEVPVMKNDKIGEIPSNHVAVNPDTGDPAFVTADGHPVKGKGVDVYGDVPERTILGGIKMREETAEATAKGHSLVGSILGGAIIGTIAGTVVGVAIKILNDLIHPKHSSEPWSRSAPPAWDNSGAGPGPWQRSAPGWNNSTPGDWSNSSPGWKNSSPPPWSNSDSSQPWQRSAPSWDNSHNKAPYNNVHNRSHSNYSDIHSNYSNTHSRSHSNYSDIHNNYSNTHSRSHSNYSNTHSRSHSNYSNTHSRSHSNYSNSQSNSWDRHVSY